MKKLNIFLLVLSVALIMVTSLHAAWAYFTTYVTAQGGHAIHFDDTYVEEKFSNWTKHVVITSDNDAVDSYVRVKAFVVPDNVGINLEYTGADGAWTVGDGEYWYYGGILSGGESTPELLIQIRDIPYTASPQDGDQFDVIVIYETVPARDQRGNIIPAAWPEEKEGGDEG